METRDEILSLLTDRLESIRGFGVRELGIFGSFARNEQRATSDVDVLVELDRNTFDAYMDLLFFLEDLFGRKVDLVVKDTIKPMIRNRVLRETIYVQNL
jgi:predicted nucleotidyltransferase